VPSHIVPLAAPGVVRLGMRHGWRRTSAIGVSGPRPELARWLLLFRSRATAAHVERAAPLLRDLLVAGREGFGELAALGDFGLQRRGVVFVCEHRHSLEDEAATGAMARELGLEAEVLDRAAVERLVPGLGAAVAGGVFFAGDAHLDPVRLMGVLRAEAEVREIELRHREAVTGFETAGERVKAVRTAADAIPADAVVLAGGAATGELTRGLGLALPLVGGRGYHLEVPLDGDAAPSLPTILHEARVAVTPMGDRLRFAGVMELGARAAETSPRRLAAMRASIARLLPAYADAVHAARPWAGLRPCLPDGLPAIGRLDGVVVATGHAMKGVSLAPITARLVAQLLSGEPPEHDLTLFRPDRF